MYVSPEFPKCFIFQMRTEREKHQKKSMENMDPVRFKEGNDVEGIETRICTILLCIDILPME